LYYFTHLHDPKLSEVSCKLTLYTMEEKCREIEDTDEETFTMVPILPKADEQELKRGAHED
jgi:hypothetical protein